MTITSDKLNTLRELIKARCLITRDKQKIISDTGGEHAWLFDMRQIVLTSDGLPLITDLFWEEFSPLYPFQICGQETAAIPLVAAIIMKGASMEKPVNGFYIRKSRKNKGLQNIIEGKINNEQIILIDDLINTGGTISRQLAALNELQLTPALIFTIIQFRPSADYHWSNENIPPLKSFFTARDFNLTLSKTSVPPPSPYKILWRFQSPNPSYFHVIPKSGPILHENKIYFGSDNATLWALNQADGSVSWRFKVGKVVNGKSIFSSPAIYDGRVYFGSYDGNIYSLNAESGNLMWVYRQADWVGSSPALAPELGLLFIGLEYALPGRRGGVVALNLKTGDKIWEFAVSEYVHCSPLYIPSRELVAIGGNDSKVYLFAAKTGELLWSYQTKGPVKASLAFHEHENILTFGSFDGNLYILDVTTGVPRFIFKTSGIIYATPVFFGNDIIFPSNDKLIYNIDCKTGQKNWSHDAGARIFASPYVVDNSVFIGANDGKLRELDAKTGKILSIFQASERITNKIAYNSETKRVFLPTFANEIYCLEKQN